jgi:hypothetical protein
METSEKITQLENEIKVLKNEIQAILLDIRENVLAAENPFSSPKPAVANTQTVIERQTSVPEPKPENKPAAAPPQPEKKTPPLPEQKKVEEPPVKELPEIVPVNNNGNGHKKITEPVITDLKPVEVLENDFPCFEPGDNSAAKKQPDLMAYAGLASWIEESTRRLGRDRTQAILDMSEAAGYLPSDVKGILKKLTTIKSTEDALKPGAKDYLESLVKIAAPFGNDNNNNAALLLILSQGEKRG